MVQRFFLSIFAAALIGLAGNVARAEETLATALPAPAAPLAVDNTDLRDVLTLQHQIQLLKRLVDRETVVNDMAQAGRDIGMKKPILSRPERDLCSEVPPNIPCAQAYADLYPDFHVAPLSEPAPKPVEVAPAPKKPAPVAAITKPAAPSDPKIFWLDISCLESECSALMSNNLSSFKARQRVHVGDIIAGATVRAISAGGVTLERNGHTVRATPAPRG